MNKLRNRRPEWIVGAIAVLVAGYLGYAFGWKDQHADNLNDTSGSVKKAIAAVAPSPINADEAVIWMTDVRCFLVNTEVKTWRARWARERLRATCRKWRDIPGLQHSQRFYEFPWPEERR